MPSYSRSTYSVTAKQVSFEAWQVPDTNMYMSAIHGCNSRDRRRASVIHIFTILPIIMKDHPPSSEVKKELENLQSKINALEIIAKDEFQRGVVVTLRTLVNGQIHSIEEFDHLKKALDLITLQMFEMQNKINSQMYED